MLSLTIPEHVKPIRDKVLNFIEEKIYPIENEMHEADVKDRREKMRGLMQQAKDADLWQAIEPGFQPLSSFQPIRNRLAPQAAERLERRK